MTQTLTHWSERLATHFSVRRPQTAQRAPVLLMLHGCGGPRRFLNEMAEVAVANGAAAVTIDSYTPRRISRLAALTTVCTGGRLQGRERAADLFAAMHWSRAQSWIDPQRIIAAGWSHGAWTIIDALALRSGAEMMRVTGLSELPCEPLRGLAGAFLAYPYAGVGSYAGRRDWRLSPSTVAIVCGRDYIVGTKTPRAALERQRARGAPIEIALFPDATHAFEDPLAADPRVRFDPDATAREHALLRDLITAISAPAPNQPAH
jgi:dienelactone hydrolase